MIDLSNLPNNVGVYKRLNDSEVYVNTLRESVCATINVVDSSIIFGYRRPAGAILASIHVNSNDDVIITLSENNTPWNCVKG